MPTPPPPPITVKFDFRHYIPNQDLSAGTVVLDGADCADKSFVITVLAENLIPGHVYRTSYELLNPITDQKVFNPESSDLYASYGSQNFVTAAVLPKGPDDKVNSYILKATILDLTEGSTATASAQINLICGIERQVFEVELVDPDSATSRDDVVDLGDCANGFPLVGIIKNALIGKEYSYQLYDNPVGSIIFEKQEGNVFAGDINQNFNSKVALTGYPYVFVHAKVTENDTGISRYSDPLLLKCFQTDPCDVVLPTGVDCAVGSYTLKRCSSRGLTTESLSALYGGRGFSIGDKLTTTGGGGYGAEIEILFGGITTETFSSFHGGSGFNINDLIEVTGGGGSGGLIKIISGGLTNASIDSLNGCAGFKVGDLLTTVGGGGKDALISVTATGVNGSISSYSIVNPGYGFVDAPTNVVAINGDGSCVSATFNDDNFTIPCAGGVTRASLELQGGSGYNIGEILNVIGGGGTGAQIRVLSGSLTPASINSITGGSGYVVGDYITTTGGNGLDVVIRVTSIGAGGSVDGWEILNAGYGFTSSPTGLVTKKGTGVGAVLVANSNNYGITSVGSITKASLSGLIGTGVGYAVGDELLIVGGGGGGAVIVITAISPGGSILDYVLKNSGSGYVSAPQIVDDEQVALSSQPTWNITKFTNYSYAIINSGCDYVNPPTNITSSNGDGSGATFEVDITKYTDPAFIVVNTGSGYTSEPTGIIVRTGDGSGVQASFNDSNFTIPCAGGITYESISGLIGKSTFIDGEELVVDGGGGSGGRIKVTGVNNGAITSFIVLNAGCGYTEEPTLKKLNGNIVNNVTFDVEDFTDLAVVVTNPGAGFAETPTGLEVLTGGGDVDDVFVVFDEDKFIEIVGPIPTRPAPTPTMTPSPSPPVLCNDLQTAGGQNQISSSQTIIVAPSGQNFIVIEDTEGLNEYSIVNAQSIPVGTYITDVTNWFANFDNRVLYKKIILNNNITGEIPAMTPVSIYSTDIRMIKVPYWPGNMTFSYDAYNVPDRFRVFAVPMDSRQSDILLFDSGYRGSSACGYATTISGIGAGNVQLLKPDGCIYIKVVVEAPCDGTAWEYALSCPQRVFTTVTSTPTPTPTLTPTVTPTVTITPSRSSL